MFQQHDLEAIGKFTLNHSPANPGSGFKRGTGSLQIDGQKIARQFGRDIGAQGGDIVVHQIPADVDSAQVKQRLTHQPFSAQHQHHDGKHQTQNARQGVHELDVQRQE